MFVSYFPKLLLILRSRSLSLCFLLVFLLFLSFFKKKITAYTWVETYCRSTMCKVFAFCLLNTGLLIIRCMWLQPLLPGMTKPRMWPGDTALLWILGECVLGWAQPEVERWHMITSPATAVPLTHIFHWVWGRLSLALHVRKTPSCLPDWVLGLCPLLLVLAAAVG